MIKASALLVALAIGLLVAGVVTSSLLMVYVSIGVCAVAALLLAAGVLAHWSEIFGRREARSATSAAWSEPQVNVTAPVLASIQAVAAARESSRPGRGEAAVRPDGGRGPEHPAEAVPSPAEVAGRGDEFLAPRRSDDLWERVEEELGSAAKRDTGALSWPGTVLPPVPPDVPAPAESEAPAPGGERPGEPRVGAGAWLWGSGGGWQPPETADPAWPPPAAAFAESQAAQEPGASRPGGPEDTASTPVPDEAAAGPAAGADVAQAVDVAEGAEAAADDDVAADDDAVVPDDDAAADDAAVPDDDAAADDAVVPDKEAVPDAEDHEAADHEAAGPAVQSTPGEPAGGDSPGWIVAASRPAGQEPAAETPPAAPPAAQETPAEEPGPERSAVKEPAAKEPAAKEPAAKEPAGAGEPAVEEPAAKDPAAGQPAPGAPEPAADEPPGDGAAAKPAPGRVEVTVVPGVSRYHRSECILIRFLGAGDLEIMTKQEAVDAKFMACRACQPDLLED